jgi:hypothetical protein
LNIEQIEYQWTVLTNKKQLRRRKRRRSLESTET